LIFSLQQYDSTASIDSSSPTALKKGDGDIITIVAYITEPSAPFSIQAFQPLGYDVIFKQTPIN
jgi:hypothetical protein